MTRILYPTLQEPVLTAAQRPESVTEDRWHQPFSDPPGTLGRRRAAVFAVALAASGMCCWSTHTPAVAAETVTVDKWFASLVDITRTRRFPSAEQLAFAVDEQQLTQPEATQSDKWFAALSEPVRVKPVVRWQIPFTFDLREPPQATQVDKWYAQLSEPARVRPTLRAAEHLFFSDDTIPDEIAQDGWFAPLSEPVRFRPALFSASQPFFVTDPIPDVIQQDRWFSPLSEPVRFKPALRTGEVQFFADDTVPDEIQLDRWLVAFSEPARSLRLATAQQLAFAIDTQALTQAEATQVDKWYAALSEPARVRPGLRAAAQPSFSISFAGALEVVTVDKWFIALSERQNGPRALKAGSQLFAAAIDPRALTLAEAVSLDRYLQPLSEPARKRPDWNLGTRQTLSFQLYPVPVDTTTTTTVVQGSGGSNDRYRRERLRARLAFLKAQRAQIEEHRHRLDEATGRRPVTKPHEGLLRRLVKKPDPERARQESARQAQVAKVRAALDREQAQLQAIDADIADLESYLPLLETRADAGDAAVNKALRQLDGRLAILDELAIREAEIAAHDEEALLLLLAQQ